MTLEVPSWTGETARALPYPLVFATVSGAHLYGFASIDSDLDVRAVHVLPAVEVVGHGEEFDDAFPRAGDLHGESDELQPQAEFGRRQPDVLHRGARVGADAQEGRRSQLLDRR